MPKNASKPIKKLCDEGDVVALKKLLSTLKGNIEDDVLADLTAGLKSAASSGNKDIFKALLSVKVVKQSSVVFEAIALAAKGNHIDIIEKAIDLKNPKKIRKFLDECILKGHEDTWSALLKYDFAKNVISFNDLEFAIKNRNTSALKLLLNTNEFKANQDAWLSDMLNLSLFEEVMGVILKSDHITSKLSRSQKELLIAGVDNLSKQGRFENMRLLLELPGFKEWEEKFLDVALLSSSMDKWPQVSPIIDKLLKTHGLKVEKFEKVIGQRKFQVAPQLFGFPPVQDIIVSRTDIMEKVALSLVSALAVGGHDEFVTEFRKSKKITASPFDVILLQKAVEANDVKVVQKLLQDPKMREKLPNGALLTAVKNENEEMVKLLLEHPNPGYKSALLSLINNIYPTQTTFNMIDILINRKTIERQLSVIDDHLLDILSHKGMGSAKAALNNIAEAKKSAESKVKHDHPRVLHSYAKHGESKSVVPAGAKEASKEQVEPKKPSKR